MKDLARQASIALLALLTLNLGVNVLGRNANGRRQAALIRAAPPCSDLFFGHSLIAGGVDIRSYNSTRPGRRALNIGLNSTGPVEHLLMLRQAHDQRPARLFYGFLDDQLTHDPSLDPLADLIGNRALALYADAYDASLGIDLYAGRSFRRRSQLSLASLLPILRERGTFWQKVEIGRRRLGSLGMPPTERNRFGRVEDMARLGRSPETVQEVIRGQMTGRLAPSRPVRGMLEWARQRKSTFYLVLMPVRSLHRERVYLSPEWMAYQAALGQSLRDAGACILDCSDWIADDLFEDEHHLNAAGAVEFSRQLARRLPD